MVVLVVVVVVMTTTTTTTTTMIMMMMMMMSNRMVSHGRDSSRSGHRQVTGRCEHGAEPSVSIKYGQFLE